MKYSMRIAFDVDDTLIMKSPENGRDIPQYTVLQLMFNLKWLGHEIYVWSGSGFDYAKTWCQKLGIDGMVTVINKNQTDSMLHRIELTVDDMDCELAKLNLKV